MFKHIKGLAPGAQRDFLLFLFSGVFLGVAQSVDGSTLANYLKEHFGMFIVQRSALEFPRELPGLLVFLVISALAFLGSDVRISVIANLLAALGMFAFGIIPSQYAYVVVIIFFYSMGLHIFMPLSGSIGMSFAERNQIGKVLGRLSAVSSIAIVLSSAGLWALFRYARIGFFVSFSIGAAAYVVCAVLLCFMKPARSKTPRTGKRLIFRKEYGLYYWLCMLYGARKQIFLTFGPWVLVEVFKQSVTTMTLLFFIVSVIGIFVKPWIGHLIDKVGERFVLSSEALLFFFACLGYAFAESIFGRESAVFFIYICYIVDYTLDSVGMARVTYMRKIALQPEDVSPSLSVGISVDHLITVFLPILGGLAWYNGGPGGYRYVFFGGAVIALLNFVSARRIKIPSFKEAVAAGSPG